MYGLHKTLECLVAVGMESGAISDRQINASSEYDGNHAATQGRLRLKGTTVKKGSWTPMMNDNASAWMQIDLGNYYTSVRGVATQGRNGDNFLDWVTSYRLQYGDNGENFTYYVEEGKESIKVEVGHYLDCNKKSILF